MNFGNRIKACRTRLGLSRTALASRLGVIGNTVYRWEKGERSPDQAMIVRLAQALDTSVAYLMEETDDSRSVGTRQKEPVSAETGPCFENSFPDGGGETPPLTLPSGRVLAVTARQSEAYRRWEENRSLDATLAVAATLAVPLIDLVPSPPSVGDDRTKTHRDLALLLRTLAAIEADRLALGRLARRQDIDGLSENDARHILDVILDSARWVLHQTLQYPVG